MDVQYRCYADDNGLVDNGPGEISQGFYLAPDAGPDASPEAILRRILLVFDHAILPSESEILEFANREGLSVEVEVDSAEWVDGPGRGERKEIWFAASCRMRS